MYDSLATNEKLPSCEAVYRALEYVERCLGPFFSVPHIVRLPLLAQCCIACVAPYKCYWELTSSCSTCGLFFRYVRAVTCGRKTPRNVTVNDTA